MAAHGIEDGANNELLHIVEIPEKFEDYSKMILRRNYTKGSTRCHQYLRLDKNFKR